MEDQDPKIGDTVFIATQDGLTARAAVNKITDEGYYAILSVEDESGAIWESEEAGDPFDTFAFGVWFDGSGLPVLWLDIDGDGKLELLAPLPKGDLSPPLFRIYRWTGDSLLYLKKRALTKSSSGNFVWSSISGDFVEGSWVDSFNKGKAEIVTLKNDDVSQSESAFKSFQDGISLVK